MRKTPFRRDLREYVGGHSDHPLSVTSQWQQRNGAIITCQEGTTLRRTAVELQRSVPEDSAWTQTRIILNDMRGQVLVVTHIEPDGTVELAELSEAGSACGTRLFLQSSQITDNLFAVCCA